MVPDVAQIEYQALPQFALPGSLVDLTQYGLDEFEADYTPSTWAAVHAGDGLYGLPQDSGPMALFYNKEVFDKVGLEVPTTWDEYVEAAKKIKAAEPGACITNDSGDAGFATSMIWQAGGTPFETDGEQVTIDLQDEGTRSGPASGTSWSRTSWSATSPAGPRSGTRRSVTGPSPRMPLGAWAPGVFASLGARRCRQVAGRADADVRRTAGDRRERRQHPVGAEAERRTPRWRRPSCAGSTTTRASSRSWSSGGFPATVADLKDPEFVDKEDEYFGGQPVNQVLTGGGRQVVEGWQYLPFQLYANTIFGDTVGKSYQSHSDLDAGLEAWQDALVEYGNEQGFQVN